jgi:tRNA modification GTPase
MGPDTIVALSTPPGRGALAVIRLSGDETREILRRVAPELPDPFPVRRGTLVRIQDPSDGEVLDRGLITFFEAPRSYTGEDVAEVSVHGSPLLAARVVEACRRAGARPAEPGEFTRRAHLNGKLDLVQAEAVADLVNAESPALQRAAVHQMEGGLSRRVGELREGLVELEALLMYHLDFPDEDEPPVPVEVVATRAGELAGRLEGLAATAPEGELLREGAVAVLAGRPNAGKSSLYNALLGEERAIVTREPGTTRDALESRIAMGGYPFRLVDTAGLRETDQAVERMGIEVARRHLAGADVVLLCLPVDWSWGEAEEAFLRELPGEAPVVLVRTCADRSAAPGEEDGIPAPAPGGRVVQTVEVSAVDGRGLAPLRELLAGLVFQGLVQGGADAPVLTHARQRRAVEAAGEEVEAFRRALLDGVPAEAAATHLRSAESALEELLGVIAPDEILDRVFRRFCIGK